MANSKFADYYYIDVKATAKVNGTEYPISRLSVSYILNNIPKARVDLAIGRAVSKKRFGTVSAAMDALTLTQPFTPIEIYLTATPQPTGRAAPPGKSPGFPTGKQFLVFKGFIAGPTQNKSSMAGNVSLSFECFGAAGALAGSTAATTGVVVNHTGNGGDVGVVNTNSLPAANAYDLLVRDIQNPSVDIWNGAFIPIFNQIVAGTRVNFGSLNDDAREALERINKGEVLPKTTLSLVAAAGGAGIQDLIDQNVSKLLADVMWNNYRRSPDTTIWDIMKQAMEEFYFSFVPAVEEDAVAPIIPTLGGDPYVVIDPSEYFTTESGFQLTPEDWGYTTDVALYLRDLQNSPWQSTTADSVSLGAFSLAETANLDRGKFRMVEAPSWLKPPSSPGKNSRNPGKSMPDQGNTTDQGKPDEGQGDREKRFAIGGTLIGDKIAETVVRSLIFDHRTMSLGGRLRMDIAPGSTVQINTIGEKFTDKKESLFGLVEGVVIEVGDSGTGGNASTSLRISSVRNKKEHENLTATEHPLYAEKWVGGKLLKF